MLKSAAMILLAIAMPAFGQDLSEPAILPQAEKAEEAMSSPAPSLSARFDCTLIPGLASDPCLTVSGLRLGIVHYFTPRLSGRVILDPFGTPLSTLRDVPIFDPRIRPSVQDTHLAPVQNYGVEWRFRPYLKFSVQSFSGTVGLPAVSRLALANRFEDGGWDQTAVTATYLIPTLDGMQALLALGNGEGENGTNQDPQQYAGASLTIGVKRGVKMKFATSFDGNNAGSDAYRWQFGKDGGTTGVAPPRQGFSADRKAVGLWLDGNLASARGLMVGVGYQENTLKDRDRTVASVPHGFFENADFSYDLNQVLVEDPSGQKANTLKRTVLSISASYLILAEHFVGFGYQARNIRSDVPAFQTESGELLQDIAESATTFGFGTRLDDGLTLSAEYQKSAYDRGYQFFHYRDRGGSPSREGQFFNLRVAYNWD